jgi:hypothetical protein
VPADEGRDQEMPIEVEAQSLDQVDEAIQSGADVILLDNLTTDQIKEALARIAGQAKVRDLRRRDARAHPRDWRAPAPTTSRSAR